jgi:hypothetical protein
MMDGSLSRFVRPLSEAERQRLDRNARALERQAARARRAALPTGAAVVGILWVATLVASDAPWPVITGFWLIVGTLLVWWVGRSFAAEGADIGGIAAALRDARENGEAEEVRIRATALVELEEVEDEGACWGFQVGERRMVFLCGQEFYATGAFPSLDMTLVHPLSSKSRPVDVWIKTNGPKATPDRTIPADRKWTLEVPGHLDEVEAVVGTLEEDLGSGRS